MYKIIVFLIKKDPNIFLTPYPNLHQHFHTISSQSDNISSLTRIDQGIVPHNIQYGNTKLIFLDLVFIFLVRGTFPLIML